MENIQPNAMGMKGITTDGKKIYMNAGYFPVELAYCRYGTDEVFDFTKPIYKDVVLESRTSFAGMAIGGNDMQELADELDQMFNDGGKK